MTTISASAEAAREAARASDGRFAAQFHSEPEVAISVAATQPSVDTLVERRQQAAAVLSAAQTAYFEVCRDEAVGKLRTQFPWATTAVFIRAWDDPENSIRLSELRGSADAFDIEEDEERAAALTLEQIRALNGAADAISEMGAEVSTYLELPDEDHDGWYEYNLDLTAELSTKRPAARIVEQLDVTQRDSLYNELSDLDGRMPSMVDTTEIAYQLTEGTFRGAATELADEALAKYDSPMAAAEAIADSDGWFQFRESIGDELHNRIGDAIAEAARAIVDRSDR